MVLLFRIANAYINFGRIANPTKRGQLFFARSARNGTKVSSAQKNVLAELIDHSRDS